MAYIIKFSVTGKGHFPLDMLRYDHCWPSSPEDVDKLTPPERIELSQNSVVSFTPEYREFIAEERTVNLATFEQVSRSEVLRRIRDEVVPTVGRWNSFGWIVSDVRIV